MFKIGAQSCLRNILISFSKPLVTNSIKKEGILLNLQPVRNTGFFNKLTQEQLWKGVVSVSNAGKRKGRGKLADKRGTRNLNFGQRIGEGKIRVLWPGLNQAVLGDYGITKIKKLPDDEKKPSAAVPVNKVKLSRRVHPIDRGWSGRTMKGKKIGQPPPRDGQTFDDFQSVILDLKMISQMTSSLGRKRLFKSIVAVGNGNGLIGLGRAKTTESKSSWTLARHKATRRILNIDLIEKHTVNHDFFSEFGKTRIVVFKKPKGYGLRCHRIIKSLCELIGIENLHAKVKGAANSKSIIRAFIVGLLRQKTYQEIADEKKLHLVEFKEETLNYPHVLASPEKCLTPDEARKNFVLFEEYIMGGKLLYNSENKLPFYKKLPSWTTYLKRTLYFRNHKKVRINLMANYGSCISHLTEMYPECRSNPIQERKNEAESE